MLLQREAQALDDRLPEPNGVRRPNEISLGCCQSNRVQATRLILKAIEFCRAHSNKDKTEKCAEATTAIGDEQWAFDNIEEFFGSYNTDKVRIGRLRLYWDDITRSFILDYSLGHTNIGVESESRSFIEGVFTIIDAASPEDKIIEKIEEPTSDVTIFIGHGRSGQWKKLKDHLQDKHSLNVISYEAGARAGHTIRDILDSLSEEASFALLVLTGEDKTVEGVRARQNVIHECGLFQGKLGFDRAILLVEKGIELASNFEGIQQIRFNKGRISEVFGDVIATIKREFGPL
jgi:hypothetical protein